MVFWPSAWGDGLMDPEVEVPTEKALVIYSSLSHRDPWDWYVYLHEWLIFMVNVSKYTSPMEHMGMKNSDFGGLKGEIACSGKNRPTGFGWAI